MLCCCGSAFGQRVAFFSDAYTVHNTSPAPLFFSFFFLHGRWCPLYVCSFFIFATHHPPVITTCSWGSVGPLPCVPGTFVDYAVLFFLLSASVYHIRTTSYQLVCTWYEPDPKIRICRYLCTRAKSPKKKGTEGLLMKLLQKNKIKNNLHTELTEMGVFSAVAGNQLPNQLQKRVLPALFHLRCCQI